MNFWFDEIDHPIPSSFIVFLIHVGMRKIASGTPGMSLNEDTTFFTVVSK